MFSLRTILGIKRNNNSMLLFLCCNENLTGLTCKTCDKSFRNNLEGQKMSEEKSLLLNWAFKQTEKKALLK